MLGRLREIAPVRRQHAQVVVRDRAAVRVRQRLVRHQRAPVVGLRQVQVAPDVGDDAQVLLHAGQDGGVLARQRLRLQQRLLRRLQVPRLQLQPAQRVERLRRQPTVAQHGGHRIALLQRAPRPRRVPRMVRQHRPTPERHRQDGVILLPGRCHDQRAVRRLRVPQRARQLVGLRLVQQRGRVHPAEPGRAAFLVVRHVPSDRGNAPTPGGMIPMRMGFQHWSLGRAGRRVKRTNVACRSES